MRPRSFLLGSPLLLFGAAACSKAPKIGVEAVLFETGLPDLLFQALEDDAGGVSITSGESRDVIQMLEAGELDLALTNGDLEIDRLMRDGKVGSADAVLHHEMVLVGPKEDPIGLHAERNFENALRILIEGDAAFFRCVKCGARAREDAIFARASRLPRRGNAFLDVGVSEGDVIRAMQGSPGYGLLSRPTVIRRLSKKEWSFKPLWAGDALQVDTYRVVVRSTDLIPSERRAAALAVAKALMGDEVRKLIDGHTDGGQRLFRTGAPPAGLGLQL